MAHASKGRRPGRSGTSRPSGYETGFFLFAPVSLSVMVLLTSLWHRLVGDRGAREADRLSQQRMKWERGMF